MSIIIGIRYDQKQRKHIALLFARGGRGGGGAHLGRGGVLHSVGTRLFGRRAHGDSLEMVVHPHGQRALDVMLLSNHEINHKNTHTHPVPGGKKRGGRGGGG